MTADVILPSPHPGMGGAHRDHIIGLPVLKRKAIYPPMTAIWEAVQVGPHGSCQVGHILLSKKTMVE